jgi:hypothetical protein
MGGTGYNVWMSTGEAAAPPRDRGLHRDLRQQLPARLRPRRYASNFDSIDSCTPVLYCCNVGGYRRDFARAGTPSARLGPLVEPVI